MSFERQHSGIIDDMGGDPKATTMPVRRKEV